MFHFQAPGCALTFKILRCVSVLLGRALEWHSRGQRFDPAYLHQKHSISLEIECFSILFSLFYAGHFRLGQQMDNRPSQFRLFLLHSIAHPKEREKGGFARPTINQRNRMIICFLPSNSLPTFQPFFYLCQAAGLCV